MSTPASLQTTKFYLPSARANPVPRPRLNQNRPLTLIVASARFGKTTLVSERIAQATVKIAWVSLYDGDNDPSASGPTSSPRSKLFARALAMQRRNY